MPAPLTPASMMTKGCGSFFGARGSRGSGCSSGASNSARISRSSPFSCSAVSTRSLRARSRNCRSRNVAASIPVSAEMRADSRSSNSDSSSFRPANRPVSCERVFFRPSLRRARKLVRAAGVSGFASGADFLKRPSIWVPKVGGVPRAVRCVCNTRERTMKGAKIGVNSISFASLASLASWYMEMHSLKLFGPVLVAWPTPGSPRGLFMPVFQ